MQARPNFYSTWWTRLGPASVSPWSRLASRHNFYGTWWTRLGPASGPASGPPQFLQYLVDPPRTRLGLPDTIFTVLGGPASGPALGPPPFFTVLGGPASLQDAVFTVLVVLLHSVAYVRALLAILFDLNELNEC